MAALLGDAAADDDVDDDVIGDYDHVIDDSTMKRYKALHIFAYCYFTDLLPIT